MIVSRQDQLLREALQRQLADAEQTISRAVNAANRAGQRKHDAIVQLRALDAQERAAFHNHEGRGEPLGHTTPSDGEPAW